MSDPEFDAYLRALGSFLRLNESQRAEIADEFRDHLETRLEELQEAGVPRDEAVGAALGEFGDAASLAAHFTSLSRRRRRKFLMRLTFTTAACTALLAFAFWAFAPPGPNGPGPLPVAAQDEPEPEVAEPAADVAEATPLPDPAAPANAVDRLKYERLEMLLKQAAIIPDYFEQPLRDVLDQLASDFDVSFFADRAALRADGVDLNDELVTIPRIEGVSLRTMLELVLEPAELTFINRAGLIYVTTSAAAEDVLLTRIYNVRDLLEGLEPRPADPGAAAGRQGGGGQGGGGLGGGGGAFSVPPGFVPSLSNAVAGQFGGGGGAAEKKPCPDGRLIYPVDDLIDLLLNVTGGSDNGGAWVETEGIGGEVRQFDGLLAVRQTAEVHRQIEAVLADLRAADGERESPKRAPR